MYEKSCSSPPLAWLLRSLAGAFGMVALCLVGCSEPGCPEGQLEEEDGCVDEDCSETRWAELKGQGFVVDPQGTGDGSPEDPFGSISEALEAHPTGPLILSSGTYNIALSLDQRHTGLVVHGRCAEQVVLDGSGLGTSPVLAFQGGGETAAITWTGTTFAFGGGGGHSLRSGCARLS